MSDKKRAFDGTGETSSSKKLKRQALCRSPDRQTDKCGRRASRKCLRYSEETYTLIDLRYVQLTGAALIAQKRAEIAAKLAAMKNPALSAVPSSAPTPAAAKPPAPAIDTKKVKNMIQDAQSRLAVKDNPYAAVSQASKNKARAAAEPAPQGVGLKMAAHPLLLDTTPAAPQSKKDRYKPMQPKFASIKANVRNAPTPPPAPVAPVVVESANPYTAAAAAASSSKEPGLFEGAPRERTGRNFRFNPKGKYVALGSQMRQEQQLEALKQRIAESARKAGLDGDMGIERGIKRPPPPDAEWWDQPLLPNKKYEDIELGIEHLNIRNNESPISIYIQHPIPIPAPGDKDSVQLKPLMLTKKERKKMRKLKRAAELQDKRDRVAMGLIPPDAPKVRLSNMMKVLTSDAVQDPTRVEARIRREVAMRKHVHDKTNAERKLTDEERREKLETKKAEEDKRGVYGAVFRVLTLSDPAHRFKVRKNAEQNNLTGVCIFNKQFSMVYVEGAAKYLRHYKKLMLNRIDWTQAARPRGGEDVVLDDGGDDGDKAKAKEDGKEQQEQEQDGGVPLEDNKCVLIWEGMLRDRSFHDFKGRSCPTDHAARELLGDKLKGYWDQAKNWKDEDEF
ncbi:unnamed protein product [Mycena citricolor]|uniref:PRP3-domain-containing protein n=1 Tax=Mycena citricolor TaxID=2018698 RepID=A0AAD2HDM3_9AGAR|nr:unnamed protein product [Mycena citricolor]